MAAWRPLASFGVLLLLLLAGCRPGAPAPAPVGLDWRPVVLPQPAGGPGRLLLRDAAGCAGRWFVVGAVADPAGNTRPAAWTSDDGLSWRALPVAPASFYGRQDVLYAAACRDGRLAALGARSGGAHGNPRVSAWTQAGGVALVEAGSAGDLSGGVPDGDVARVAGGPGGWLVVGGAERAPGTWGSADGRVFHRWPVTTGEADVTGAAVYDVVAGAGAWWAVGSVIRRGGGVDPVASVWSSADGRAWRRVTPPAPDGGAEVQRVAWTGGGPVAVGRSGDGFRAWWSAGGRWSFGDRFGSAGAGRLSAVRGFGVAGAELWAVVTGGDGCRLWRSPDRGRSWREAELPAARPPDARAAVTAQDGRLLLVMDDGRSAGSWVASSPVTVP
ncbi:hypothetical protein [Micromonospora sp. MA102]|uniref:hypothetical protein n=1 Tax=Micromonospora sp. MA102 TaxID=2952755 RepID=UPI0021C68D52|nr:hypothetical protein [Micromonospora sp. MA102]